MNGGRGVISTLPDGMATGGDGAASMMLCAGNCGAACMHEMQLAAGRAR
jgi:hypothetical protein